MATEILEFCAFCGRMEALKHCSRCKCTCYCNQTCQRAHWNIHKKRCRKLSKLITPTTTTQQSKYNDDNKEKEQESILEGYVFLERGLKLWAVCNGPIIFFYTNENNNIPYDAINIFSCDKIQKATKDDPLPSNCQHGLKFLYNKNVDIAKNILYGFEIEEDCNKWYKLIGTIKFNKYQLLTKEQHDNDSHYNYDENDVIFQGEVLYYIDISLNTYTLFYMILTANKNFLLFAENKRLRHVIKGTIALEKHISVECDKECINFAETLFKYGLKIRGNEKNVHYLFFKNKDQRHEWMAHIQFIIINQVHPNQWSLDEQKPSKSNVNNKEERETTLLKALHIYEEFIEDNHTNKDDSLMQIYNKLKIKYVDLLNMFNNIIFDKMNQAKYISKQCTKKPKQCAFFSRYQAKRDRNVSLNKTKNNLLNELLDRMHCYFYHKNDENARNISNKFVINTEDGVNEEKQNQHTNNSAQEQALFAFGEALFYCNEETNAPDEVVPKYRCLKYELLNNPYYQLTENQYNYYYIRAFNLMQTERFQNIRVKQTYINYGGINVGDPITINHVISLLIYCNQDALQKEFKKHTRRVAKNESNPLCERNAYIAHWTEYLIAASCWFGEPMKRNAVVYCGLNTKLLFNSFYVDNFAPLSTTTSIIVANNFASRHGIILKLKRNCNEDWECRYFDMMLVSDYVEEREKFFCFAKLQIIDIIIDGKSNADKISALNLMQMILSGTLFYTKCNKYLYTNNIQNILIKLLDGYIMDNVSVNAESNEENQHYFKQLFSSLIYSFVNRNAENDALGHKIVFINIPQINKLKNKLVQYFLGQSILFSSTNIFVDLKVNYIKKYFTFKVSTKQLNHLKAFEEYKLFVIGKCKVDKHLFEVSLMKHSKKYCWLGIQRLPYIRMAISFDVVCEQLGYQCMQQHIRLENGSCAMATFLYEKLKKLNSVSIDLNVRIVKIQ